MANFKGKRMVDEDLIKKLEDLQPGGGGEYTAGEGISIDANNEISANIKAGSGIVVDTDLTDDSIVVMVDQEDIPYKSDLATVATTGDYDDLTNKPTIPAAVSGTNDGTNWTSITIGDTTKAIPSGGGSSVEIDEKTIVEDPLTGEIKTAAGGWKEETTYSDLTTGVLTATTDGFYEVAASQSGVNLYDAVVAATEGEPTEWIVPSITFTNVTGAPSDITDSFCDNNSEEGTYRLALNFYSETYGGYYNFQLTINSDGSMELDSQGIFTDGQIKVDFTDMSFVQYHKIDYRFIENKPFYCSNNNGDGISGNIEISETEDSINLSPKFNVKTDGETTYLKNSDKTLSTFIGGEYTSLELDPSDITYDDVNDVNTFSGESLKKLSVHIKNNYDRLVYEPNYNSGYINFAFEGVMYDSSTLSGIEVSMTNVGYNCEYTYRVMLQGEYLEATVLLTADGDFISGTATYPGQYGDADLSSASSIVISAYDLSPYYAGGIKKADKKFLPTLTKTTETLTFTYSDSTTGTLTVVTDVTLS